MADRIEALHGELGFGSIQLVTGFLGNLPQSEVIRTIELFAKEMKPRLHSLLAQPGDCSPADQQWQILQSGRRA